jgi:hypothetical protein
MSHHPFASRFVISEGVLRIEATSSAAAVFACGGKKGRLEVAFGRLGCDEVVRLFAEEKGREEFAVSSASCDLVALQASSQGAAGRVEIWKVGSSGKLLCEVGSGASAGQLLCWDAFLCGRRSSHCWLLCAHSNGDAVYLNLSNAAACAFSDVACDATPSVPTFIQNFVVASNLQAIAGQLQVHAHSLLPTVICALESHTAAAAAKEAAAAAAKLKLQAAARRVR